MSGQLLLIWVLMLVAFYFFYVLGARNAAARTDAGSQPVPPEIPSDQLAACESRLSPLMIINTHRMLGEVLEFDGRLRGKADEIFERIREAFAGEPVSPMLLAGEEDEARVLLVPASQVEAKAPARPNWALHWLLFLVTVATTTWAGALHGGVNLLQQPARFAVGLPYSLGFLFILGAHELGHYFTAKAHGIQVTPPFFIPVPFALGTFGAFIKIKSLPPNRAALFDVAVAGPLAGLVFAIPALLVGLHYSRVIAGTTPEMLGSGGVNINSSILLAFLHRVSLGPPVLAGNHLLLHPLAFAGWLGLMVTALNLLPIGQLDGGHMSHALFGSRHAHGLSVVALSLLFFLALFVWPGLLFWAVIVFFIAGTRDAPAANDLSPVGPARKALGYFAFLLLLLIIVPVPRAFL